MRNKGASPGGALEGDLEDECGVSSSVPRSGGVPSAKWYSLPHSTNMRQPFTNHTDMLYVNLESCPSSPTYLERDPNMSCTARYSPTTYVSTTTATPTVAVPQVASLNTTPPSASVDTSQNSILAQHYQRTEDSPENQQQYLQYHSLNTDRLAPLLQVLENVTTSAEASYYPSTVTETYGVSSTNGNDVTSGHVTSTNVVSTTVCDQPSQSSLYMPVSQESQATTVQSTIGHPQPQLIDTADLQFILTSDCEYEMMEGSKADQVELFIARDPSGTSYSLTTENGFLIARPTVTDCPAIKAESAVSGVNSMSVDVSILDSLDEATQFDEEHHNIVMEAEINSPNLHFNQSDELVLHSSSSGDMTPSRLEEVECSQMVDLEEIVEYLGSQPPTPAHEEVLGDENSMEKSRPNRRRQPQFDNTIMCIPDKTVPCRARASLPITHLSLGAGLGSSVRGVFARRRIPVRARFGPLEGCKKKLPKTFSINGFQFPSTQVKFLVHTSSGDFVFDVSDERTSNWMCYVRFEPGPQQNVCLHQSENELFFITCRPIAPRQELILGYGTDYAKQWGLPAPPVFAAESDETTLGWPCYECSLGFPTDAEFQAHLNTHDEEDKQALNRKRKKKFPKTASTSPHDCSVCSKTFSTLFGLKRHVLTHEQNNSMNNCIQNQQQEMDLLTNANMKQVKFEQAECTIKKEEDFSPKVHYNMEIDDLSDVHVVQKQSCDSQQHNHKKDFHYYVEQEQLVPDSQMDNDTLDSNCTDLNAEDSYDGLQKDSNMSSLDVNMENFVCNLCNKVLDSAAQLEQHSNDHESSNNKPLSYASYAVNNSVKNDMEYKQLRNTKVNDPVNISSNVTDDATENKSDNIKSDKPGKEDSKLFVMHCPLCPRTFKNGIQVKEHAQIQHMTADGKYECGLCSMTMPDYRGIKKHILVFHAVRKITCQECSQKFATNDKLKLHMLKHSDRRDFECIECGKQFKRRDKLKDHAKKQHSGQAKPVKAKESNGSPPMDPTAYLSFTYKCHPCKRGFKRRGMLVNHLAKRHPDVVRATVPELQLPILRVARNYYCQYCDKVYKSSSKRKAHIIKNHPGESIPPSSRGRGLGNSVLESKEGYSKCVGAVPSSPHMCPHQPCHKQYASKAKLLQHIRLKHSHQVAESKENNISKIQNSPSISKSEVSSSTGNANQLSDKHHASDFSNEKIMKPNKTSYQQYDNLNEKLASPNILTKSKIDQGAPIKWDNKILSNLLNSDHSTLSLDQKYNVVEPSPKPLAEIKLGYLGGSSSLKQPTISSKNNIRSNQEVTSFIRNSATRLRIIQLPDGTQIIEGSDLNQIDVPKKISYGKLEGDGIQRPPNLLEHVLIEGNKLPPVSVLAGNSNRNRYTDR